MFRARHIHFSNKVYHFHIIWWYIQVVFLYHFTSLKYTFKFKTDRYTTSFKFSYPLKKRLYPIKTIIRISRCYIAFSNQPHFNRFHSSWIAFTSGLLSVFCPAKPAIILTVHTIIYIIFFCCFPCQSDPDRLQLSCSVRLSIYLTIFRPGFPSIIFSMFYTARFHQYRKTTLRWYLPVSLILLLYHLVFHLWHSFSSLVFPHMFYNRWVWSLDLRKRKMSRYSLFCVYICVYQTWISDVNFPTFQIPFGMLRGSDSISTIRSMWKALSVE